MFDCHYDLLTFIYMNKNNIKDVQRYIKKVYREDNICGGIFNLFYMSPNEMKIELNIEYKNIHIIENLKEVNKLIEQYKLLPSNIKYIYGIEGLDYLEKIEDIGKIYEFGVRSVNPVWNNDNKFGGGAKGDKNKGLTKLGEELILKLVETNIAIDLSHSNEKTFNDIIDLCTELKNNGKKPIVFASHSNVKKICNHSRNLNDNQIMKIKELNGIIGIVGAKPFCIKEESIKKSNIKYQKAFIEHIKYIKVLLGNVDNIAVSTDDMSYYETNKRYYKYFNVFKQKNIKRELETLLLYSGFNNNEIEKILYMNFQNKILNRLNGI